jgi:predicted DNA-binding transcriptional regulator YafY
MNRIDRVTAVLIQLQSKRVVKAQEIADRFGISLRTVYRDIRTLEAAGIPILSEAGIGYSIMKGYRLPPVMFTKEEATALLTAEKLVEKLTDKATAEYYQSAMFKIKAVLHSNEKELLEDLEAHIAVVRSPAATDDLPDNLMPLIFKSITERKVLHLQYFAHHNEKTSERNIEPIGIYFIDGHWHLMAYCQLRKDYRDFRIDRIMHLQTTPQTFKRRELTLQDYLQQMTRQENLQKAVILFDKTVVRYLQSQKFYYGFVSEVPKGKQVEMTFLISSCDYFARWLLMFTDAVEIVSPDRLKEAIRQMVQSLQKHVAPVPSEL